MTSPPNHLLRVFQRLVVGVTGGRGSRVGVAGYRLATRVVGAVLVRGERDPSVYARAGLGAGDLVPGLSDVDIVVVLPPDPLGGGAAAGRVRRRYALLLRLAPPLGRLFDVPCAYDTDELSPLTGASYATFGLGAGDARTAAYGDDLALLDRRRILERPGLYSDLDWRLLRGPERRPAGTQRDGQQHRIAAWLELAFWWRFAYEACVDPTRAHTSFLCAKLVAEPARIWLWLAHREQPRTRREALELALERLPEEEAALRTALDLLDRAHELPAARLAEVLPCLVRLSARIAGLVTTGAHETGTTAVRLLGTSPVELAPAAALGVAEPGVHVHPPAAVPLCDWRALAVPTHADESFLVVAGDPGDPATLARAAHARSGGGYHALAAEGLLLFPIPALERPLPRVVSCAASDPVSHALVRGGQTAAFPLADGWSLVDSVRRAVAEQRARLAAAEAWPSHDVAARALLAAARPALVSESAEEGDPVLPVTLTATARLLRERAAVSGVISDELVSLLGDPAGTCSEGLAAALRPCVLGLRAFRDPPPSRGAPA